MKIAIERSEQIHPVSATPSDWLAVSRMALTELSENSVTHLQENKIQLNTSTEWMVTDTSKDMDTIKVRDIQNEISAGAFTINTDIIAKQMMVMLIRLP